MNTPGGWEQALAQCKHGIGKGRRASQLPGPPGIPVDAGAGLFHPVLNACLCSGSPGSAAVINPGHLPSRASTSTASLGLANKATTTTTKRANPPALALGSEVPYCTGEELRGSRAGQAVSGADGSPQPYGANLSSAGNYSSDVSREEAGVPGLVGLFAASREAVHPWVQGRGGNGFRKRSSITEDAHRVTGVGMSPPPPSPWGCCCGYKTQSQPSLRTPSQNVECGCP